MHQLKEKSSEHITPDKKSKCCKPIIITCFCVSKTYQLFSLGLNKQIKNSIFSFFSTFFVIPGFKKSLELKHAKE